MFGLIRTGQRLRKQLQQLGNCQSKGRRFTVGFFVPIDKQVRRELRVNDHLEARQCANKWRLNAPQGVLINC